MKRYSANVWETLIEALHIYWHVVKECCPLLLAVFVPLQLVMALYRYSVASSGAENLASIRFENFVVTALGLTLGLVAVAIVVDSVFLKCTGQRRPSGGGIAAAWGRMMATGWLRMVAEVALIVVASMALAIVMIFVSNAPLTQVGKSASAFSAIMACIILAPLAVALVWILVRWSFAIVLSAIHPIMGSTAMGASWRFSRGRFACCLLLLVAAWLVMTGIFAIPNLFAVWYARGEMIGLPTPSSTALTRTVVMFLVDLFVSFGSLSLPVALTIFWIRTVEPCDLPESIRRGPTRLLVVVLLVIGVIHSAIAGFFAVKAAIRAKEERDQQRAVQRAELQKALERLRKKSVETDCVRPVVHPLPDAYKEEHMRMENGELVVDSPFDLCIGSTEAAKMLGTQLTSSPVNGTYSYGTNLQYYGFARLATPYFGFDKMSLTFMGEEKALFAINLFQDGDKLSLDDCRKRVRDIAADIEQRFGVKMDGALGDMRDEVALKLGDDDKRVTYSQFMRRETKMENGGKIVQYEVRGMIETKNKQPNIEFEIAKENER